MKIKILSAFILFCIGFFAANAQTAATVKGFTLTNDHIPGSDRKKDMNGVDCALVKIQVLDDIERVEGNKIGDIVKRGVEKRVYMCKGSRNMTIHLKNHLPVRVMFRDYKISGLESNRVYELVIEIPDAPATLSAVEKKEVKQKLILRYSPSNAFVFVDNIQQRGDDGLIELELPVGSHEYLIVADGYLTDKDEVNLNERAPKEITVTLSRDPAYSTSEAQETDPKGKSKKWGQKGSSTGKSILGSIFSSNSSKEGEIVRTRMQDGSNNSTSGASQRVSASVYEDSHAHAVSSSKSLNKTFTYYYQGVTFKCKAKNGNVTITEFDHDKSVVTIPAQVEYDNASYPVVEISTFINGNNYGTEILVIEEGVQRIDNRSFIEFRKLQEVTLPGSIREIGKDVFRKNTSAQFHLPPNISEGVLRTGSPIKVQ